MREFDRNSLEKFFRSKLKYSINNQTTWNDPGDQIFDDAFESFQENKKENSKKILVFAFLFGFIGIISTGYFLHKWQMNNIKEELKELEYKIAVQERDLNEVSTLFNSKKLNKTSESTLAYNTDSSALSFFKTNGIEKNQISQTTLATHQSPFARSESISSIDNNSVYNINSSRSFRFQSNPLEFSNDNAKHLQPSTQETRFSNKTKRAISAFIVSNNRDKFQFINLSTGLSSLIVEGSTPSQSPALAERTKQNKLNTQGFSLTASTGVNYARFNMRNSGVYQGLELSDYNNYSAGQQFNLGLSYAATDRLSFGIQATYNTFQNQSVYTQSTEFDQQNLSIVGDKLAYEMPIDVMTPIGAYSANSVLNLDSTSPLFRAMDTETIISQYIKTFGLALTSSYAFISSRKIRLGVSSKVGFYRIVDHLSTFDMTISEDNGFTKQLSYEGKSLKGMRKNNASISAGVFASYALSKNISFNINSSFNRSLTSITNHENENQPRTFLNYFDSNVGISYNF